MLFAIICTDRPASFETRKATRERHLAYLEQHKQHLVQGGPLLDAENRPCGSLLVVDVADRAAAEGFAAADPYAEVDLFESVVIRPFRSVFRDGLRVE